MLSSIVLFFNIGTAEIFVIILVIIIFFGSKKIPDLMRGLGKGMREFKNATSDIQEEINKSARAVEREVNLLPKDKQRKEEEKPKTDTK